MGRIGRIKTDFSDFKKRSVLIRPIRVIRGLFVLPHCSRLNYHAHRFLTNFPALSIVAQVQHGFGQLARQPDYRSREIDLYPMTSQIAATPTLIYCLCR